jgi:purine-binding chemotaxis protein CheW
MVDLAKIRKKAKEKRSAEAVAAAPAAGNGGPPQTPESKLQAFLATAGTPRFPEAAPEAAPADEVELLTFLLGAERYAIDIEDVAEITDGRTATRVPNAGRGTVGIFSLRGSIVTLLDVRSRLRQPPAKDPKEQRVIVVRDGAGLAGFEVDRVLRPAKIVRAAIEPQPVVAADEQSACIIGVVRNDNALTIVLDLSKLLEG